MLGLNNKKQPHDEIHMLVVAVELQGSEGRRVFLKTYSGKNYDIEW